MASNVAGATGTIPRSSHRPSNGSQHHSPSHHHSSKSSSSSSKPIPPELQPSPDQVTEQEAQRSRVITSQDSLDTVIEASIPVEPVGIDDQINQAQADGDWQTSSALKAEKLKELMERKL